jgi:hypothetical protein
MKQGVAKGCRQFGFQTTDLSMPVCWNDNCLIKSRMEKKTAQGTKVAPHKQYPRSIQ